MDRHYLSIASIARRLLNSQGGFTIHSRTGAIPVSGWAVSLAGGRVFDWRPDATELAEVFTELIEGWAQTDAMTDVFFGGWWDKANGLVCIDLTVRVYDRSEAIVFAAAQEQRAIFNLATGETAYVPALRVLKH